jgi:hypothetical protein
VITLTGVNQCGSVSDTMNVSINQEDDGVNIYPNPSADVVYFVCNEGIEIISATVLTQSGVVLQANIPVGNSVWQYDLSVYPPGTFIFNLATSNTIIAKTVNKY